MTADNYVIDIWYEDSDAKLLESIFVGIHVTSSIEAFDIANKHVLPLLSIMSFKYRRPFGVREIHISDGGNEAKWLIKPFCTKPIRIKIPRCSFMPNDPLGSMFALYREGMNNISCTYRYLCFFKIFEAWVTRKSAFRNTDTLYKRKYGEMPKRPRRTVTKTLLAGSYNHKYHYNYLNKYFKSCFQELSYIRDVIAHPFKDENSKNKQYFANLDEPSHQAYISALANLVERIATKILDDE